MNPEVIKAISPYFEYWLAFLSLPMIAVFILTVVYFIDRNERKRLTEAKKYDRLFK